MCIAQARYKTSYLYGKKIILLPVDIYKQLRTYIDLFRGQLKKDQHFTDGVTRKTVKVSDQYRPLFPSSSKVSNKDNHDFKVEDVTVTSCQLKSPAISSAMTKSFQMAHVFHTEPNRRVNPTIIGASMAT